VSILAVEKGAAGFSATPMFTLDQTRKQARVTFDATPARLVGGEGEGWPTISTMLDLAAVALAAEQAGGAQKVLEMAVKYAKALMPASASTTSNASVNCPARSRTRYRKSAARSPKSELLHRLRTGIQ
jgi:hypothetical protein